MQGVSKKFGPKLVVENMSFSISKGTITVLLGPNGAGKSTIAKIILGIESPTSGILKKASGIKISYLPQNLTTPNSMPITCGEFARINNINYQRILDFAPEDEVLIKKIWDIQISTISSGQRQLFSLLLSLCSDANLIVLDEPTSFLDVDAQTSFYKKIKRIKQEGWRAIFLISHDMYNVISSADQVLCINHHICCSGKPLQDDNQLDIFAYKHMHDHKH